MSLRSFLRYPSLPTHDHAPASPYPRRRFLRVGPVLVGGLALLLLGQAAPAAPGVFSLDRLRLGSATGPENYVYTTGDLVVVDGGVDPGTHYRLVVTDSGGTRRNPSFSCTPSSSFTSADNSYTIQGSDPVSTGTAWRLTHEQFTNPTCSGTPAKSTFKSFYVAKSTSFVDPNLTSARTVFGANAAIYVSIAGVKPGINDWSTTWLLPSGAVACANTAGNDRPDASNVGGLPKAGNSFLQYRPLTTQNGSLWNRESNYEAAPCPGTSGADGEWRLKVQLDATNFVVLPAFTLDSTPPPAPIFQSGPQGATASTSATFTFSSSESGVNIVCRLDSSSFVPCTSPTTYNGLAQGNHSIELKAIDAAGNESSITPRTWSVNTTAPPPPTIVSGPSGVSTSSSASFQFSDTDPNATFICQLDGSSFSPCTSPQSFTSLAEGSHTFGVAAVDTLGNQSATTARNWVVNTKPPVATIVDGPTGTTGATSATFSFNADEAGSTFQCQLDAGGYSSCASPHTYSNLSSGSHTFAVRATDLGGSTSAPATRSWTIDGSAPNVTLTTPANGSATSDLTPVFAGVAGTAVGDSSLVTVDIYAGTIPGGSPAQVLSGERQPGGAYSLDAVSILPEGIYTAQAKQTDDLGNVGLSTANTFRVDAVAPTVTITSGPADPTNQTSATLVFGSDDPGTSFECRLDAAAFAICTSPKTYTGLGEGAHTISVKAADQAGNESGVATHAWAIDTTAPPQPTIDSGPSGTVSSSDASFSFSTTEIGGILLCQLDGAGYAGCTSPTGYTGLASGSHTFQVKTRDAAGNDSSGASRTWSIDASGPSVTITSSPANPTNSTGASFGFVADETGSTFQCRLDGGSAGACSSPKSYVGLAEGAHTFEVTATDPTGNAGSPTQATWNIDLTAPAVSLDSPADGATITDDTPTFSGVAGILTGDAVSVTIKLYTGTAASGSPLETLPAPRQPNGSYAVDAAAPLSGTYTVRAEQVDSAGNLGLSAAHTFTVVAPDTVPPNVSLTVPASGATTADTTPSFAGTAGSAPGDLLVVTVNIYSGTTASGSPVAILSAAVQPNASYAVDASSPLPDGTYTAQAQQADAAGNTGSSQPRTFAIDTDPPAVTLTAGPANPTNHTNASFSFSADEPGSSFECRLDASSFVSCSSPQGYVGIGQGSHTFHVRAIDPAGTPSPEAQWIWTVDTTPPPAPTITAGPLGTTNSSDATFAFSDGQPDVSFACRLDGGGFVACTSPKSYTGLASGSHTFDVKAVDQAGNESVLATRTWTADTTAPTTTITGTPASQTNQDTATFSFVASEVGSTFECKLNNSGFGSCTSPQTYTGLLDGSHTFDVRATDSAGNTGPPASFAWVVDTTPSDVTISSGPSDPSTSRVASFTFTSAQGVSFVCQLDGGGFAACSSPKAYSGLADGTHMFEVKAVDGAGNTSAPASQTWTVDASAPVVTLVAPAAGSSTNDHTPTFSGIAGTATGDSAAVMVKVYSGTAATGAPLQTLLATHSGGVYSLETTQELALGTYTVQSEQADTAGNLGLSTANTFVIAGADTTPPAITLTSPANGGSTGSVPTFSGSGGTTPGDLASITVELFAGSSAGGSPIQVLSTTRDAGTGAYSVPASSGLGGGTYTARSKQSDGAGNVGFSTANTFTVGSPYPSAVLGDTPGGYWRLGETSGTTAADASGTNAGAYQNGVLLGQLGALSTEANAAASFDGVNDVVTVPSASSLNATTGVTVEAWVKRTKSGAWQNIVAKPGSGATAVQNYALWINTQNKPAAYFGNGSATASVTSPTALDANWHHIAATYDNATARIYVDGVLSASATSSVQLTASTGSLVIGRTLDNNRIFGGVLDEVAVYRSALTSGRIQAHYAAGSSLDTTPPSVTMTTPANGSTIDDPTPTFGGASGTAAGDLPTVTVKVYSGPTPTGTPVQTLSTNQSGGVYSVDAQSPLSEGTYTARAEQLDSAGNLGTSGANTFTFTTADITPPSVTLTTPANGSSTQDTTPDLSGSAGTVPGDLSTITVKIWAGIAPSGTPLQSQTVTASGGSWSATAAPLAEGVYALRAEQSDSAGNVGYSSGPHAFTIGTSYRDAVLADAPDAFWRLGENSGSAAGDETGTNPGTYGNGVVLGQTGALTGTTNTAALFDGVDDSVTVPSSPSLTATNAVTVEAWVKRTKSSAWQNVVAKPGSGAAAAQNYALWINTSNQPVVYFGNGTTTVSVTSPSSIDTNWHHLVATYDEATARLYVDGVLRASVNSNVQLTANNGALTIGRSTDNLRVFGGLIDEPAVYRSALSANRILLHYQKGNAIDTVSPVVTLTTPVANSSTINTIPHFAGGASTTGTDSTTVTLKLYAGAAPTGSPLQTLTASWFLSGAWSVDASSALPLGTYTAQVTQTDFAGNVGTSAAHTFTIVTPSTSPDPLMAGAGDIADCTDNGVNATAALILGLPSSTTVFTLGDNVYPSGAAADYTSCYGPTWGQFKSRTRPAIGDHDYETLNGSGYFNYFQTQLTPFGASATDPSRAYYSYDIGTWHVVVLNGACSDAPGCSASGQASWLDADLAAHANQCTYAILAAPRWSSGSVHGSNSTMGQYFQILYDNDVEFLLGGDDHLYERFAPQDPQGFYDPAGVRQFVVGTGGGSLYSFSSNIRANSEVRRSGNYGILKVTLHPGSYEWQFVPTSGGFSDAGSTGCH